MGGLALAWATAGAWADDALPEVTLTATVGPDLRTVTGTLLLPPDADLDVVDALTTLPVPEPELEVARTFPGAIDRGTMTFTRDGDVVAFTARLPKRWGDVGATGKGLYGNGAWYPTPLRDGALVPLRWTVHVAAPPDATLVVGGTTAHGTLDWSGDSDRVSLAVVPRGRTTPLQGEGWSVDLVTRGRPRRALVRNLADQLPLAVEEGHTWTGTVVQAPLRRRLVRPGQELAYVSDRAFRTFTWFQRTHREAVVRGLVTAWQGDPDPFVREVGGAAFGRVHNDRLVRRTTVNLLGLTRWIPFVDAALYTREMAFQQEVLHRVVPTDRVADDLAERFAPHAPGTQVAAQVADTYGAAAAQRLGRHLALGWSLSEAATAAGVPLEALDRWRVPYPSDQDYTLALDDDTVTVHRSVDDGAPAETVVVAIDGERRTWEAPGHVDTVSWTLDAPPHRVVLDPDRHTAQRSRIGDTQPARIRWTLWGQVASISASQAFASAYAVVTARGAADTYNQVRLVLSTNQRERLSGLFGYTRYFGPLTQPTVRQHSVTLGVEGTWLNPNFPSDAPIPYVIGGSASYAWDNRESTLFPRNGGRVAVGVSAGGAPGEGREYFRVSARGAFQKAWHPRHVLAGRLATGFAATDIPQQRLTFGGWSGVRGIPDDVVQTDVQGVASLEYRPVLLSQGSVPLWLLWLRDVNLLLGIDGGVGLDDGTRVSAVGASAGLGLITDNFGVSPGAVTATFAWPLWTEGLDLSSEKLPFQVYVTWGVTF